MLYVNCAINSYVRRWQFLRDGYFGFKLSLKDICLRSKSTTEWMFLLPTFGGNLPPPWDISCLLEPLSSHFYERSLWVLIFITFKFLFLFWFLFSIDQVVNYASGVPDKNQEKHEESNLLLSIIFKFTTLFSYASKIWIKISNSLLPPPRDI